MLPGEGGEGLGSRESHEEECGNLVASCLFSPCWNDVGRRGADPKMKGDGCMKLVCSTLALYLYSIDQVWRK